MSLMNNRTLPARIRTAKRNICNQALSQEKRLQQLTDIICRLASTHNRQEETEASVIQTIDAIVQAALDSGIDLTSVQVSLNQTCDDWWLGRSMIADSSVGPLTPLMAAAKEGNRAIAAHLIKRYSVQVNNTYYRFWNHSDWHALRCAILFGKSVELIAYLSSCVIQQHIDPRAIVDIRTLDLTQSFPAKKAILLIQALKQDAIILKLILPLQLRTADIPLLIEALSIN